LDPMLLKETLLFKPTQYVLGEYILGVRRLK
jgi:hypothetical protein